MLVKLTFLHDPLRKTRTVYLPDLDKMGNPFASCGYNEDIPSCTNHSQINTSLQESDHTFDPNCLWCARQTEMAATTEQSVTKHCTKSSGRRVGSNIHSGDDRTAAGRCHLTDSDGGAGPSAGWPSGSLPHNQLKDNA